MNIAIVDDSASDRQFLAEAISRYCTQALIKVQSKAFDSGTLFLAESNPTDFDVIFLDIYMNGVDGIETAEKIREKDRQCILIFSTTSEHHAVKSYRVRAFDYLVKPYSYKQFAEIMQLCIQSLPKRSHYIEVKSGRSMVKIMVGDILFTDYANHYIQIHTSTRVIKTYMHFNEFAPILLRFSQFLCCYRNCIINMDAVEMMLDQDFVLRNDERLPIAKSQRNEIRQQYADYVFEQVDGG